MLYSLTNKDYTSFIHFVEKIYNTIVPPSNLIYLEKPLHELIGEDFDVPFIEVDVIIDNGWVFSNLTTHKQKCTLSIRGNKK